MLKEWVMQKQLAPLKLRLQVRLQTIVCVSGLSKEYECVGHVFKCRKNYSFNGLESFTVTRRYFARHRLQWITVTKTAGLLTHFTEIVKDYVNNH